MCTLDLNLWNPYFKKFMISEERLKKHLRLLDAMFMNYVDVESVYKKASVYILNYLMNT